MADHYTLRLAPGIKQRLTDRARRSERSLAQRYVDEGLRHDAHPLIQFLVGPSDRRASLAAAAWTSGRSSPPSATTAGRSPRLPATCRCPPGWWKLPWPTTASTKAEIDQEIEFNEAEYELGIAAAAAGERALRG
jgi:hypothetical protein